MLSMMIFAVSAQGDFSSGGVTDRRRPGDVVFVGARQVLNVVRPVGGRLEWDVYNVPRRFHYLITTPVRQRRNGNPIRYKLIDKTTGI